MNKKILLTLLSAMILVSGCLLSGTFSFKVRLTNLEANFSSGLVKETVDLSSRAQTWDDHKDEIAQIESMRMDAIVVNNTLSPDTLGIYVAADSNLIQSSLAASALPVLTNYVVPAQTTDTLFLDEAMKLMHVTGSNWIALQRLIKTGMFTAYASSSVKDASIQIGQFNLYVSFTTTK